MLEYDFAVFQHRTRSLCWNRRQSYLFRLSLWPVFFSRNLLPFLQFFFCPGQLRHQKETLGVCAAFPNVVPHKYILSSNLCVFWILTCVLIVEDSIFGNVTRLSKQLWANLSMSIPWEIFKQFKIPFAVHAKSLDGGCWVFEWCLVKAIDRFLVITWAIDG